MEGKQSSEGSPSPGSKFKNLKKLNFRKQESSIDSHALEILKKNGLEPQSSMKVDQYYQARRIMEALSEALFGDYELGGTLKQLCLAYLKNCFARGVEIGLQGLPSQSSATCSRVSCPTFSLFPTPG